MSGDKGVAVWASPAALLHGTILLLRHLQQPFIHPFSPKRSCCVSFGMPGGLLASSHPAVSTVWTCLWWGHRGLCASSWGTHGVGLPQQQGLGEHQGLRSLLPRGCHQQSTRPQGGWEKPPEKPPVRREAAGPRRLGLWDEKSLRWLCWLFVDSSWLSWGLKATLKLSKQTLISQFSQPACNLSLALLYRGGSSAQLWCSLCSEHPEQQWPGHRQGERARAVPVSQHHSSIPDKASCVLQGLAQTSTGAG